MSFHIKKSHFASSFFASFTDVYWLVRGNPLQHLLATNKNALPFALKDSCKPGARPPDIVLVLSESAVPPSFVPGWKYDPALMKRFLSYDKKLHRLRIETQGGGTWITHTALISGLSMGDFGWMRPYVTMLMTGNLRHGLPEALVKCGYQTAMLSPMSFNFVNEGPMLTSLGIKDYLDLYRLKAPSKHEGDRFYLGKALDYYTNHLRKDGRPLFLFVSTMAAHSPHDYKLEPHRKVAGFPFGNDTQTDEYLRRLTMAQADYAKFVDSLKKSAGDRPVLAVQFGDHQPLMTPQAFQKAGVATATESWRSAVYETFYAVTPINFVPAKSHPPFHALDVAFLGVTLLEIAGLPMDDVYKAALNLRDTCNGAFHTCSGRKKVDHYLSRLVRSELLLIQK